MAGEVEASFSIGCHFQVYRKGFQNNSQLCVITVESHCSFANENWIGHVSLQYLHGFSFDGGSIPLGCLRTETQVERGKWRDK